MCRTDNDTHSHTVYKLGLVLVVTVSLLVSL